MSFTLSLSGSIDDAFEAARRAIKNGGGRLYGDSDSGSFEGKSPLGVIRGDYRRSGSRISFDITKKPAFVSMSRIESKVRDFFAL